MGRGSVCFMVGERVIADGEVGDVLVPSVGQTIEISGPPPGSADNGEYAVEDVAHRIVLSPNGARSTVFVQLTCARAARLKGVTRMTPDMDLLGFVAMRRDRMIDAELCRIAPHLADVPERVARFLGNVQRMLTSSGLEASRYAAEVAREAEEVALLRDEWADMRARIAETVAAEAIRVPRPDDARLAAAHARIAAMPKEKHHEAMARASRSYSAPRMCVEHDGCRIDAARMEMVWPDGERWPMRTDAKERT